MEISVDDSLDEGGKNRKRTLEESRGSVPYLPGELAKLRAAWTEDFRLERSEALVH